MFGNNIREFLSHNDKYQVVYNGFNWLLQEYSITEETIGDRREIIQYIRVVTLFSYFTLEDFISRLETFADEHR